MTRLAMLCLLAAGVYALGTSAPDAFANPLVLTATTLGAAAFGAIALRSAPDQRYRRAEVWRRSRRSPFERFGRGLLTATVWAVALTGFAVLYESRDVLGEPDYASFSTSSFGEIDETGKRSTVLTREHGGHFVASAVVNGRHVRMLVDTGSSDVALPFDEAIRLGVDANRLIFDSPVMTANGQAMVAPVTLATVAVDDIVLNDVRASVAEPGKLGSALLGMSFLGALAEVKLSGDQLILKQ